MAKIKRALKIANKKERFKLIQGIRGFTDVEAVIKQIEDRINQVEDSVSSPAEVDSKETEGNSGDTKITKNSDGTYNFEIRAEDGWKVPMIGGVKVKFKDKEAKFEEPKKDIAAVVAEDELKGGNDALKTFYDEKNDKFDIQHLIADAEADYDSGWFSATTHTVYATGATDGVAPDSSTLHNAGDTIGIPALGFTMERLPARWSLCISDSTTTSWDDIDGTSSTSWVIEINANTNRTVIEEEEDHRWHGIVVFVSSPTCVAIMTNRDAILELHDGYHDQWPGNNFTIGACKMNLRVWK